MKYLCLCVIKVQIAKCLNKTLYTTLSLLLGLLLLSLLSLKHSDLNRSFTDERTTHRMIFLRRVCI